MLFLSRALLTHWSDVTDLRKRSFATKARPNAPGTFGWWYPDSARVAQCSFSIAPTGQTNMRPRNPLTHTYKPRSSVNGRPGNCIDPRVRCVMRLIRDPPHTLLTRLYNIFRLSITAALPHLNKLPRSIRAGISLWVVYIAVDGARELPIVAPL